MSSKFSLMVVMQGLRIMDLYSKKGIDPKRIYIKVYSQNALKPGLPTATFAVSEILTHL